MGCVKDDDFARELMDAKAATHLRLVQHSGNTPPPPDSRGGDGAGIDVALSRAYKACLKHQSESISIVVALMWGAWVGNPAFDVYAIAPSIYQGSARFATELVWGSVVFTAGLCTLLGFWRGINALRHIGLLGLMWIWAVGFLAALDGPSMWTTAPVSYPVLCWIACWAYFQVE